MQCRGYNVTFGVHHIGVALGACQPGVRDMEFMFPEELARVVADIVAGATFSPIARGPDKCVCYIPAGETTVAVYAGTRATLPIPCCSVSCDTMPDNFGDRIQGLPRQAGEIEVIRVQQ